MARLRPIWCILCALTCLSTGVATAASPKTLEQVFEEHRKFWEQHHCAFPDPSTYSPVGALRKQTKHPDEDNDELALTACTDSNIVVSSPLTDIENITVEICTASFDVSRMLCRDPAVSNAGLQEKLKWESLAPLMTSLRSGSACSVLRNELNVTYLSFLSSAQACRKYCEQTPKLAPLCRLLTAVLKQSSVPEEHTEQDKWLRTTPGEHATDTQSRSMLQTEPPLTVTKSNTKAEITTRNETFEATPKATSPRSVTKAMRLISSHPTSEAIGSSSGTDSEKNSENSSAQVSITTGQAPSAVTNEPGRPADRTPENTTPSPKNMTDGVNKNSANQTQNSARVSDSNVTRAQNSSTEEHTAMSPGAPESSNNLHWSRKETEGKDLSLIQVTLWLTGALMVTIVVFLLYKNTQRIKDCAMKIASTRSRRMAYGSKAKYKELKATVDDMMPSLGKQDFSKSHYN